MYFFYQPQNAPELLPEKLWLRWLTSPEVQVRRSARVFWRQELSCLPYQATQ